jgi:phage shock protein A
MSEEKLTANVETLRARIAELDAENEKLKAAMTAATKTLTVYVERERETAIKSIMEKSTFSKEELEKLDLTPLKLIEKGIDNVKGTVKSVRSAAAAPCADDSKLTVGCLLLQEGA